jgi:hypothetical protein
VIFRRARFASVIRTQLELFERDHRDVIEDARAHRRRYSASPREEAEEAYGDYVDALETGTEILADLRDHFARSLEDDAAERYVREFNSAVARRLPEFALEK